ncbi:efflux RND transporter periplasmic adaptor subunit [Sulfuritalea sp.]|uniref:efflux RND transporter periplasmic adaptor subunit n=1 Tax=Sulfuritalea sp. TaxID=2480090 RepID=UPI001AC2EE24|nr:efflux RND transporter periplasmic adaptor subunit [Sulfuritalea sp.]MBN8473908.1 efflux RND transporter periplasmic adaptor subunit [Sulfuritalea sp.]
MNKIPFAATLAALFLVACSEPPAPAAPLKLVRTLKVGATINPTAGTSGDTANSGTERSYSGEVRARIETTLGFRIPGKIVERRADVGQAVKPGQVLARLDPADAALQATQAEAQRALAAADLARTRDLRTKNFVSAAALDARETAFKAAEAQAQLAKNQAAYTTLVADRAGVIGQVLAEPGQVVSVGQAVFRLAPDGEREIAISIPEGEVTGFKLGQAAEVRIWSGRDKPIAGSLREIAPAADPVTRTFAARISLKDADPRLPLGMTATVRFTGTAGAGGTLVIPLAAVFQQGDQPAVWKVGADGTVNLQRVKVAALTDAGAVVSEGLAGGEQIVAAGVNLLTAGEKVRIAVQAAGK